MKKLYLLLCLVYAPGASAENLCGAADQLVCLQNSLNLGVDGLGTVFPGTTLVISVPGIEVDASLGTTGVPSTAYRLSPAGQLLDNQSGVWSDPLILMADRKGAGAIAFTLEAQSLTSPMVLSLRDVEVCQFVIDGPTDVKLTIRLFVNFSQAKTSLEPSLKREIESTFELCREVAGNLPLLQDDYRIFVVNPHTEAVVLTLGNVLVRLEAKQRLDFRGGDGTPPFGYAPSLKLATVMWSEGADLNLTAFNSRNHTHWLVPHIARDTDSWNNFWIFASGSAGVLSWVQGGNFFKAPFGPGAQAEGFAGDPGETSAWARMVASHSINGFFEFARSDGLGGAGVNAVRTTVGGGFEGTRLYLPHVARDAVSFWTGYSLANPHGVPARVQMTAFGDDRGELGAEVFEIPAGANDIGLVGLRRLAGLQGTAWILIESDQALAGLQLIGDNDPARPHFSGFLLPQGPHAPLSFPVLKNDSRYWSGISFLNPTSEPTFGVLAYHDRQGKMLEERIYLAPLQKKVLLAPLGAGHAFYEGDPLIAFCLLGENGGGKIGAYLGR